MNVPRLRMRVVRIPTMGERLEEYNRERGLRSTTRDPREGELDWAQAREGQAKQPARRPW